jgi:hypothetical protein
MTIKMNYPIFGFLTITGMTLALLGCSTAPLIGNVPSDPPPKIAYLGARDVKGNEYLTWENVSSFGAVPSQLKSTGDQRCMQLGSSLRALGYHPAAKDQTGKAIEGGGFFCAPTLMGN